mgnify:CR=1 FL=1
MLSTAALVENLILNLRILEASILPCRRCGQNCIILESGQNQHNNPLALSPLAALATVAATWMRSAGVRMIVGVAFRVLENVARFVIRRMLGGR